MQKQFDQPHGRAVALFVRTADADVLIEVAIFFQRLCLYRKAARFKPPDITLGAQHVFVFPLQERKIRLHGRHRAVFTAQSRKICRTVHVGAAPLRQHGIVCLYVRKVPVCRKQEIRAAAPRDGVRRSADPCLLCPLERKRTHKVGGKRRAASEGYKIGDLPCLNGVLHALCRMDGDEHIHPLVFALEATHDLAEKGSARSFPAFERIDVPQPQDARIGGGLVLADRVQRGIGGKRTEKYRRRKKKAAKRHFRFLQ